MNRDGIEETFHENLQPGEIQSAHRSLCSSGSEHTDRQKASIQAEKVCFLIYDLCKF